MFDLQGYLRVLISISAGLITLLGAVGIFVSVTVQRRVERLQDILEEFMDLSYHENVNLTSRMHKLIEKYQMHYIVPDRPTRSIVNYVNATIAIVIIIWFMVIVMNFTYPLKPVSLFYFLPILGGFGVLLYFRYLLRNVVIPSEDSLLRPLIPSPRMLRSVSFLSKYVSISVKSILSHARLRLLIKCDKQRWVVILKEELSFDDFFYLVHVQGQKDTVFLGLGELGMDFGLEPITKKPVPAARNVNIPLGFLNQLPEEEELKAEFFIFPRGEKHPIQYNFTLRKEQQVFHQAGDAEISINYLITYRVADHHLQIIDGGPFTYFQLLGDSFRLDRRRWYWPPDEVIAPGTLHQCGNPCYID